MGDFYQNGFVATLHNLRARPYEELEQKLEKFSKKRPIGLIIPSLYSELSRQALKDIVSILKGIPYIDEIVIGLDRADDYQYKNALEFFAELPQHHRVLWNDGPRMQDFKKKLASKNIVTTVPGKGRNVWFCFGYMIASARSEAIALHDADIITYNREMLARLIYPVADPSFNFKYCKGYYFRTDDEKLHGRAVRLLVTPLLRTLKKLLGHHTYLEYLDSFRYPLAGEFSMRADVIKTIRIPYDWGLEIGILNEVERNNSFNRICQVEIADRYDHKHQSLSIEDAEQGLSKMSRDVSRAIFAKLASDGITLTPAFFRTLKATYYRIALEFVELYKADAAMNGLTYDFHKEEEVIDLFVKNVYQSGISFLDNPDNVPLMPSWKRVQSAFPGILEEFREIVEADNNII
ncbi:glycosyltransferase family protein [Draconibacterium halophilum]|uniref:Glycosyl transferase n=1 Tax=Draconibacterium halophilum TaxID=2706887 RepID=A0A6C0RCC8_9BACT|nr:glycosyl transferase [Draconibacterium halophilum]QIA08134.1 glycosyl transferase [Draconibacterium halophilum]